jgi:hypothetical protein
VQLALQRHDASPANAVAAMPILLPSIDHPVYLGVTVISVLRPVVLNFGTGTGSRCASNCCRNQK